MKSWLKLDSYRLLPRFDFTQEPAPQITCSIVKKLFLPLLLLIFFSFPTNAQEGFKTESLSWKKVLNLPDSVSLGFGKGFAGHYTGVHQGIVILAGGTNFPEKTPWEGGAKKYWDQISLIQHSEGEFNWKSLGEFRLPKTMAYGSAVSGKNGLILLGGENEQGELADVIQISIGVDKHSLEITTLPSLPWPMANTSAVILDEVIYLAGAVNSHPEGIFLSLDLKSEKPSWRSLPSWPGPTRTHSALVVQSNGETAQIHLIGGRYKGEKTSSEIFSDHFAFQPSKNTWIKKSPITLGEKTLPLSAFAADPLGSGHILLIGGVEAEPFNTLEKIQYSLADPNTSPGLRDSLVSIQRSTLLTHPGFSKAVLAYHTVTDTWTQLESLDFPAPVHSSLVTLAKSALLISGEIAPGERSPEIYELNLVSNQSFGVLNYSILIGYLAILILIGIWVSRKQHDASDYFKAGGRVPWWAAGISVFGTQLSAITFMAIPAKTFATDWTLFFLLLTIIMISPVIIAWFLPFFRRLDLTTAYEYLELRFNRTIRLIGSMVYVALQLGRLGIVLLLPSLALAVVTGIDVEICILIMGVLSIFYTVLGGIEAVIWTDVVQVVILLGGAFISLIYLGFSVNLNWEQFQFMALDSGKMRVFDWNLDFSGTAIWVILFGGLASNLVQYGSDQTVIQRYLTTKDEATAAKGIRTGAWMALPSALIFFSIGTALYLFYKQHPEELSPIIPNTDSIFPWYIVTQLPNGVSGLLIAAVFAAAMSSLDSSMNSVATVITTDFHPTFSRFVGKKIQALSFARTITIIIGTGGTALALWMANLGIPSLWDQFNMLIGLFAGGLGGIFLIGILSEKANAQGALIGFIGSAVVQVLIKYQSDLSIHLYALTGLVSAMGITWMFSRFFPSPPPVNIKKLTLKSLIDQKNKETKPKESPIEA